MLNRLHLGVSPQTFTKHDGVSELKESFIPRCLPTKGALQCIEEFPLFSSECIDQFIHKKDVNFGEIEKYWIRNPLLDKEDETLTEKEVC